LCEECPITMNILLTCAGRRNYLIEFFQNELGERGRVIACDTSAAAPALAAADEGIIVPAMNARDYCDALLAICRERQVRLLISANDLELAGLARRAEDFYEAGTIPVISNPAVIATCQDKWSTFQFLRSHEIPTPDTYLGLEPAREALARGALKFPIIVKPRWGSSSIGLERVENDRELALAYEWGNIQLRRSIFWGLSEGDHENGLVFQEQLQGDEYGMDVVNDFDGNYVATLARRKLVMRCGNTDRAVSVDDHQLERLGDILGRRLAHVGPLDCDVMMTDSGPQVLDLNPRIGGGYPFSHRAGANLPAALCAWANREEADPAWLKARPGVLASRCDGILIVNSVDSNARRVLC
jgi:carbamoyl-phosphate synthase large subunit